MRSITFLLPAAVALLLIPLPVAAQLSTSLKQGAVVRWQADGASHEGTVRRVDDAAGELWVRTRGQADSVPITLATPKLMLRTQANQKLAATGIGLAVGAAIGLAAGDDHSGFLQFTAEEKAVIFGSTFGLIGLVVGKNARWGMLVDPTSPSGAIRVGDVVRWGDRPHTQGVVVAVADEGRTLSVRREGRSEVESITLTTTGLAVKTSSSKRVLGLVMGTALGAGLGLSAGNAAAVITYGALGWVLAPGTGWAPLVGVGGSRPAVSAYLAPGRLGVQVAF